MDLKKEFQIADNLISQEKRVKAQIKIAQKYAEHYQALQLQQTGVSGSFTVEDMISFANWCRNGLTNLEYSIDKIHEHLEYWIENYR